MLHLHIMFIELFTLFSNFIENQDKLTAATALIFAKAISAPLFFPGTPLTVLSGAILGTFLGTIISVIGNVIGATLAFLLARYLLRDIVQNRIFQKYPKIKDFEQRLFSNGLYTVIFLRLVPIFPFNALNFVLGVTKLKFKDYFLGTLVGIIPGTFAFVYLGESFVMLSWINILLAVVAIGGLSYIGKLWKVK